MPLYRIKGNDRANNIPANFEMTVEARNEIAAENRARLERTNAGRDTILVGSVTEVEAAQ